MSVSYDFTTVTPRYNMGSGKWDEMKTINPNVAPDVIPFSVADMEFQMAPEIIHTLQQELNTRILGYTNATESTILPILNIWTMILQKGIPGRQIIRNRR